jgi:hypothetical protein
MKRGEVRGERSRLDRPAGLIVAEAVLRAGEVMANESRCDVELEVDNDGSETVLVESDFRNVGFPTVVWRL